MSELFEFILRACWDALNGLWCCGSLKVAGFILAIHLVLLALVLGCWLLSQ